MGLAVREKVGGIIKKYILKKKKSSRLPKSNNWFY